MSIGNYTRNLDAPINEFDARTRAFLNDDASQLSPEQQLTADQIKAAAELAEREDQAARAQSENAINADVFLKTHPWVKDSKANAQLFKHELRVRFGNGPYTIDRYEEAYQSLLESSFLALDEKKFEAHQQEIAQRHEAEKAALPSEEDLYTMPLEDLRRLDAIESQKRMQQAGERGGNGF